ncbi:DUF2851 family protein [Mucilaginibacter agri]|uniref:DUF2851 family protein n=1 Tax=Mucilaginibacter agri TaxID=2695265 RepID=A0A965ZKD2_9SPHI|nr:DUF2851 family protein [Mucilaginibacter agri]NCD71297.1 DUF2851 family protein [Mucilaginibacter agri]
MLFTEDFLYHVWKFRLYDRDQLRTTTGETIEVINPGTRNTNAGADFQQARIKIGDTLWAGNVEIHVAASDWQKHNHQQDRAYDNVILHVVYRNDLPVETTEGNLLPTLELEHRIPAELYGRYHSLVYGEQKVIPCESAIHTIDDLTMRTWLTRVLVERLEKKSAFVIQTLNQNRGDWEETFYQHLASSFGFKINSLPFEMLAKSLPQIILSKHKNSMLQIEALIFGQAGFLEDELRDDYPNLLKKEYQFLRKKYGFEPLDKYLWKFLRLRPLNFPTIRLAQFAALISKSNHLFSKVLEISDVKLLRELFTDIPVNAYWETHYRFDVESNPSSKEMGLASIDSLLLNTLALFLFSYGRQRQQEQYVDRSLALLEQLPAEQNSIISNFDDLGVKTKTAFESQALLELKNNYCNYKKCLQCSVGNKILKLV